jgi:hypothetical protein
MSSTAFVRQVFAWLAQVNADGGLKGGGPVKIAVALTPHFNEQEGGMAWPSLKTLGKAAAKSESRALEALRLLETRGHLEVEWGKQGAGHFGRYWMVMKTSADGSIKLPHTEVSEGGKTSVSTAENFRFDPKKLPPAEVTLSKDSSKEPSNSRAREEVLGEKKGNGSAGTETEEERAGRWWAMVAEWFREDEAGWRFHEWGPPPGDDKCQIPDSVLMELLILLESPKTPWHVSNALRVLEQKYLSEAAR